MELVGIGGGLFWAGLLVFWAGIALAWTRLGRHGGLDRSRTLHVIFDDDSPLKRPENRSDQRLFVAGVFAAAFGAVTVFTGITTGDLREKAVCVQACRREGFDGGFFAPSATEKQASGLPERACWCAGPAGSQEMPQQRTLPPSTPALPGSSGPSPRPPGSR